MAAAGSGVATREVPALLIAAPASGHGKTTVTSALARRHRALGRRVRVFKAGPDFLDPMVLEAAAGTPAYQLDLWMGGEAHCRQLLYEAAGDADLILVEGMMGLFDGTPSCADLASRFGLPVLAVIDASAMAQSFGAIALGLSRYRQDLPFAGVFANRVAGPGHYQLLADSLPEGIPGFGWLPRSADIHLPERHLGLVQALEVGELRQRIEAAAACIEPILPPSVSFPYAATADFSPTLKGRRIAVARDAAFSFIYPANLDLLQALGAEVKFFSPLTDTALPTADALYLPGGYPELHLQELSSNRAMHDAIRNFHRDGGTIVAECGGLLYLAESLTDADGQCADLVGLLPGRAAMQSGLANLGFAEADLGAGTLRGHSFHHSTLACSLAPIAETRPTSSLGHPEPIYRLKGLVASYQHWYLPSNPAAAAAMFLP